MKNLINSLVCFIVLCFIAGFASIITPGDAKASTVVINALANNSDAPAVLSLGTGSWTATPIKQDPYAWSPWNSGDDGRWRNTYFVDYGAGPLLVDDDPNPNKYDSPDDAFNNAGSISFTLTSLTAVYFWISDDSLGDNRGGMTLDVAVNAVPIPGAFWLIGSGLIGLGGIKRKIR